MDPQSVRSIKKGRARDTELTGEGRERTSIKVISGQAKVRGIVERFLEQMRRRGKVDQDD